MHIVNILTVPEVYGPEGGGAISTVARNITRELELAGHRATVLTPDAGTSFYVEGEVVPIAFGLAHRRSRLRRKLTNLRDRRMAWPWPDYRAYLSAVTTALNAAPGTVDAVIVHNDPGLARRLAESQPETQVVLWLHNLIAGSDGPRFAQLPPRVHIVSVSRAVAEWTAAQYGLEFARLTVIHNGVDSDLFHPRADFTEKSSVVAVVAHGRVDPGKGHHLAAAAVRQLRSEGLPVTFSLLGGVRTFGLAASEVDDYVDELKRLIADAEGVWISHVPPDEVAAQLREFDVACVLSTSADPFPLTVLEAMSSGCAIVGSRRGGIPEAIASYGVLVEGDNVEQTTDALRTLVCNPLALSVAKAKARTRALDLSWRVTVECLLNELRRGSI